MRSRIWKGNYLTVFAWLFVTHVCLGNESLEGTLKWDLESDGRMWSVEQVQNAEAVKTDLYYGETLFQSLLEKDGQTYSVDHLSRKIIIMSRPGPGERGGPDGDSDENTPPMNPPDGMPEAFEVPEPVGNVVVAGIDSLQFQFEKKGHDLDLCVAEGMGLFPMTFFMQFETTTGFQKNIVPLLRHYQGLPARVQVTGKKDKVEFSMVLTGFDSHVVDLAEFELPDYLVVSRPMGGGKQKSKGGGKRGGGGGGRGGMGMGGGGGR